MRMAIRGTPGDFGWLNMQQYILSEIIDEAETIDETEDGKIDRSDEQSTIEKDLFAA